MPYPRPSLLSLLLTAAVLSGCATTPPPAPPAPPAPPPKPLSAEQILRESQGMAQLGQRHKEGEDMVREGEGMVREGNARIAEGQRLIDAGKKIIQESERGYGEMRH